MEIVKEAKPPTGLRRIVYRLPIRLYRMGLGWLFGHRLAAKRLCRIMEYAVDAAEADFPAVGRRLPFVRFVLRA